MKKLLKTVVKNCIEKHLGIAVGYAVKKPMVEDLCKQIESHYEDECKFCTKAKKILREKRC